MKREFKIPTVLALLLLVGLLGGITVFTNYFLSGSSFAQATSIPQHIVATTITDTGFTVSWETDKPTLSALTVIDSTGQKQTFFDERHGVGDTQKYTTTNISVKGLSPDSDYKIELLTNGKVYIPPSATIHTGMKLSTDTNGMAPVYGSVMTKQNTPAEGALVFLTLGENSQILSTLVKPSGSWIIPLNLLRNKELTSLIKKNDERQQISITIRLNGEETTILTDTFNASPIPNVILGSIYDFRGQQAKKKTDPRQQNLTNSFSTVLGVQTDQKQDEQLVQLISPPEGAHIPGDIPLFSGRGVPGNLVTLILGIKNIQTQTTKVASDGTWRFSPQKPLGIGPQRVTMTTLDQNKKPVAVTHLFEIMKSGTQVLGDATPSATIATTPTKIPTPLPTSVTPIPTLEVTPTILPSPTPTIPNTATTLPTNMLLLVGIVLLFTGLIVIAI